MEALRNGLVDMVFTTDGYYVSAVPEVNAFLSTFTLAVTFCYGRLNVKMIKASLTGTLEITIMMISLPIFMPIVHMLGFNPVWFGVIMLINFEIGMTTPPFGMMLFVMKGVAWERSSALVWGNVCYSLFFATFRLKMQYKKDRIY